MSIEKIQNLIIFDDMVSECNFNKVSKIYLRGRKSNYSVIFISQSYFGVLIPVGVSSDYLAFTKNFQGNQLIQVAKDQPGFLDIEEIKKIYRLTTKDGHNLSMIYLLNKSNKYRFRKNFDYGLVENKKTK